MQTKRKRFVNSFVEAVLLVGVLGILILTVLRLAAAWHMPGENGVSVLNTGWYSLENGEKTEFQFPAVIKVKQGQILTLYNDSLSQEDEGKYISTRAALYGIRIKLGNQVLYEYDDERFPRNDQMKAKLDCWALLPSQVEGQPLSLTYTFEQGGTCRLSEVYIGNGGAMAAYHFSEEAFTIVTVLIMLFLALLAVCVAVYFYFVKLFDPRFLNVAVFLFLCAIWCATDSSMLQNALHLSPMIPMISFYVFMLLAVPMLHFLKNTGELGKYRILSWLHAAFYVNAIVQGILNYTGLFDFVDMLFVTHILLIVSVVAAYVILTKECREKKKRELRTIRSAFVMLSAGGLLALLLYWLWEIFYYAAIFETGILVFVILLLAGIISTMADNIRFRTEMAVYQRLAREDPLTGLKNRTAFEEYMISLQKKANTYENVALIFMDLNQLKNVNDCYGHNAGDELLISASRCIENAFSQEGSCYRIGGDEFCVIIENPKRTEEMWSQALDEAIVEYNKNSRFYMSIARGVSYLRDEQGVIKRISDWKYEADVKMYKNKGRMKRI